MLSGGSDLLQNNETACQVEAEFKLPGYDSAPSFLQPLAIKYSNTKAVGWTISHLNCRCLNQPPKTDARVPCLEHREGVYQRQVSSKDFTGRGFHLHMSVLPLTPGRGNIPLEILRLKYYLTFGASPITLQEHFAIISVQQRAECLSMSGLLKKAVPASLTYIPWNTINHPEIIHKKRRGRLL